MSLISFFMSWHWDTSRIWECAAANCWVTEEEMLSNWYPPAVVTKDWWCLCYNTCWYTLLVWHVTFSWCNVQIRHVKPNFSIWHFAAAHHHQSAVETSAGAGAGEESHQVNKRRASAWKIHSVTNKPACPPISLTESFPHKLGCFDSQCAEMLLLHWWGFTRLWTSIHNCRKLS